MTSQSTQESADGRPPKTKAANQLSRNKKLLLGLVVCVGFFAAAELAMYLWGVRTLAGEGDPLAGFSSGFPLFEERQIANQDIPLLATATNRLSYFNPQAFPTRKSGSAYRIFCLGGSTTYGRPYDDQTSFAGFLRATLPQMDPTKDWEVVNAGGISYGSTRVALLMRELAQYESDLFVVYTGHNEFLEEQTFSSVIHTPESVLSSGARAAHLRTFSVLHRLVHGTQSSAPKSGSITSDEVDALLDQSIGPNAYHRDDAMRKNVFAQFRKNLEQIITLAQNSGAGVVLVTPAANLRDCRPFKSEYRDALTGKQISKHRALYQQATEAFDADDYQLALQEVTAALAIDDRHAATQFLLGKILWAQADWKQALQAFTMAREEDICPLRAPQQILEIVRDVAKSRDVSLIDFERGVAEVAAHHVPGDDWFLDHVHPTIAGHELLARRVCETLIDEAIASPDAEWRATSFQQVAATVRQQINPQKHAIALRNLAKVLDWAGKSEEADPLAVKAAKLLSGDSESQTMAGFAALRAGKPAEAKTLFEAALKIDSRNVHAIDGMGSVLSAFGQFAAAAECFSTAVQLDPKHVPSWFNLGNAARQMDQLDMAATAYQRALALVPEQPDAHKNLGLVRLAQGQIAAAIKEFEMAQILDVSSPERYTDLGFALLDADELPRAEHSFQAAAEIDPNSVSAVIGIALVKERQQDFAAAAGVLRRGLTFAPDNAQLRELLERMRQ